MVHRTRVSVLKLPQDLINKITQDLGLKDASRVPHTLVVSGIAESALKAAGASHGKVDAIVSHIVA